MIGLGLGALTGGCVGMDTSSEPVTVIEETVVGMGPLHFDVLTGDFICIHVDVMSGREANVWIGNERGQRILDAFVAREDSLRVQATSSGRYVVEVTAIGPLSATAEVELAVKRERGTL